MVKALFCIFSAIIGLVAIFVGLQSLNDLQWQVDSVHLQFTEPPFVSRKLSGEKIFGNYLVFDRKSVDIRCFSYDDFLENVEAYREDDELAIQVKETHSIREGIIQSAIATSESIRISYEPSLMIVLKGYGSEELIMEMERENDQRFLRLFSPNTQYARSIARTCREMGLAYALNVYGLTEQAHYQALQEVYFPRYTLEVSKVSATFENDLTAEELQLRMKGIIYDSIIQSFENGWEMVVFEATIKNLKALQSVLDEMMPLPVQLIAYPFWRDDE